MSDELPRVSPKNDQAKYQVYLAGPMTNIPAFNFPAFFEATAFLRERIDWQVLSPAEKDLDLVSWEQMQTTDGFATGDLVAYSAASPFKMSNAMEWDLPAIMNSDGIVLLEGWEKSTGARWERTVAEALGRQVWLGVVDQIAATFGEYVLLLELDPVQDRMTQFLRTFPSVLPADKVVR